jgi:intracellular sulfur oxidation DsrE/DsrF family protein
MPERPIPRPQTMVGSGMPVEVQMKAIAYMVAMRAPHPDDVGADPVYAADLVTKLKPIVLSMDSGADKRLNRVEVVANGRQIDLLMAGGCDEKTPQRAVTSRAGVSFPMLVSHGVLVIRCNDSRVQCLQSTRDSEDVLCTTAPRHK